MDTGFEMIGQSLLDLVLPYLSFVGKVVFVVMLLTIILPLPKRIKGSLVNYVASLTVLGATYYYFTSFG